MKKGKKSGNQDRLSMIVLITAILNLIRALIDLISRLNE